MVIKNRRIKRSTKVAAWALSIMLAWTMMPGVALDAFAQDKAKGTKTVNIAILSDIHYVSDANRDPEHHAEEDFNI